ncbi:MAG: D-alanyl-D-alanine carboxypeptidase/D-alanyl-D-alanine-endopeptidase [Solirubrobacterales bacterium]|nr:D-alanyl-D-alanine carboxypeptidase/D-alanyl-D-alanine-endopeptidase [Solirubrobacterales bacterium]
MNESRLRPNERRSTGNLFPGVFGPLILALLAGSLVLTLWPVAGTAAPPAPRPGPDRAFSTPIAATGSAGATVSTARFCRRLRSLAGVGNSRGSLEVRNLRTGKVVCSRKRSRMRELASNTKILTTATALARLGPSHRFQTRLFASGRIDRHGTLHGNLFLKGGGDPALGSRGFLSRYLGGGGTAIDRLARKARRAGVRRVTGRLFGDDTVFDRRRGVADSGYATSPWIGPLSGLSFNAGFTSSSLSRFSSNPARLATRRLARSLRASGIRIRAEIGMRRTPAPERRELIAGLSSPDLAWNVRVTNINSNNFFAEMLLKNLGAAIRGRGTTRNGTIVVRRYAASQGVVARPIDGSGLTHANRASAEGIARLLARIRTKPWSRQFLASLPIAGREGTLASRMRGSAAEGRCHAKTGTLTGVSALSGYCFNRSGHRYAFSILMNGVHDTYSARYAQDRIAAIIASL